MSVEKRITDVSDEYAIMCKKANAFIKAQINPNNFVYAKIKDSDEKPSVHIITEENINNFEDPIRVFSQRELERLIFEPDKTCAMNFLDISTWIKNIKYNNYLLLDSMEKLVLCYLMDKVYSKKWVKREWVTK